MTQFIQIYDNAFSKEYCESLISFYKKMEVNGYVLPRQATDSSSKLEKDDDNLYFNLLNEIPFTSCCELQTEFNKTFWEIYTTKYMKTIPVLQTAGNHGTYHIKMQKTKIGGGYHLWHFESSMRETCNRMLAWTLYLNDVDEGGETEYLYQTLRIKPKQGTLVIFPASFTHVHRGNPPLSGDKYILTGWIEF